MAEGTNAPAATSVVTQVRARIRGYVSNVANHLVVHLYSDGLAEDLVTFDTTVTAVTWSGWTTLTVPSGGWTWAKVASLELKAWKTGASYTAYLHMVQVEVTAGACGSVGAVAAHQLPAREMAAPLRGANSGRFTGAGWHDLLVPVNAVSTTITVLAKFDSNYAGGKPQMMVMNIPGVGDQTATMTAAANTEEQLSLNFTPSTQGVCRVRLKSRDTSPNGLTIFDDLKRA